MGFFLNPIGLLALLAVPAVIAIHLFRRRFRPHVVSALFLWADPDRTASPGRKPERLRGSASLLLEVAAAALLALAFAGLKLPGAGNAEHFVAVLDESASMGAHASEAGSESAADRARSLVRDRILALPRGSRVTLVASGAASASRPRLLAGPAVFPAEALARLAEYSPRATSHDLLPAVALGLEVAGGDRATILVVTDHFAPETFPPEAEVVSVGVPLENMAIAHAGRAAESAPEPGAPPIERIRLTIAHSGASAPPRRLVMRARGSTSPVLERPIEFAPGARRASFAIDLPPGTPALEVALEPSDALAIDDRAYLVPAPPRPLAVASAFTEEEERLLGWTRGSRRLDRLVALVPDASATADVEAADLVLAGRPVAAPERAWVLSIESGDEGAARLDYLPPFLAEKRHPLLAGVTLAGLVWSASESVALTGGIPLVSAGNVPLLTESPPEERRLFRLNLDIARATLARSPDWPILLANLLEMRRRALPGPERVNLVSGEPLVYRSETEATYALERAGEPALELRARGALVVDDPGPPGFVTLRRDGAEPAAYAVRFADAAESDLSARRPGRRESSGRAAIVATRASGLAESLLLAAALLAVLGDWFVLTRRPRPATKDGGLS